MIQENHHAEGHLLLWGGDVSPAIGKGSSIPISNSVINVDLWHLSIVSMN